MLTQTKKINVLKKQNGAALIVSLVLLAVITLIGVTGMQTSSLEWRMTANVKDRVDAFEMAEATLLEIEDQLQLNPPHGTQFLGCTDADCYTSDCTNGLCFSGEFDEQFRPGCRINDVNGVIDPEHWKDESVWTTATKHKTFDPDNDGQNPVKYIIEFLCFTPVRDDFPEPTAEGFIEQGRNNGYVPLYRITARAQGNAERGEVMLQSTFRVNTI